MAGHADDGDGVAGRAACRGRSGGGGVLAGEQGEQVAGQGGGGGVVEDEGGGQGQAGGGGELVAQFDGGQGVEALLVEGLAGMDGGGGGVAQDGGGAGLDVADQQVVPLGGGRGGELLAQLGARSGGGAWRACRGGGGASSASSGLGRCAVNAAANLPHSTSAKHTVVSPLASASRKAAMPRSGGIALRPRRSR